MRQKTGKAYAAVRQAEDYALNLACFHEASAGLVIVPIVLTAGVVAYQRDVTAFDRPDRDVSRVKIADAPKIDRNLPRAHQYEVCPIVPSFGQWPFLSRTTDHRRRVALYSDMNVFEIGHSCSAREDLDITTETIVHAVENARSNSEKVICFVTGVPGAGKP